MGLLYSVLKLCNRTELANKIGKSYQIYQTWENGSRNPKDENLRQLADALNVSFEYLTDTEILPIYQKLSDDNKQQTNKQLIMLRIN